MTRGNNEPPAGHPFPATHFSSGKGPTRPFVIRGFCEIFAPLALVHSPSLEKLQGIAWAQQHGAHNVVMALIKSTSGRGEPTPVGQTIIHDRRSGRRPARPDVVLLELRTPGMDSPAVLQALQERHPTRRRGYAVGSRRDEAILCALARRPAASAGEHGRRTCRGRVPGRQGRSIRHLRRPSAGRTRALRRSCLAKAIRTDEVSRRSVEPVRPVLLVNAMLAAMLFR